MDSSLTPPSAGAPMPAAPMRRLMRVVTLIRYRFFLYAGLLPYLLGAAWAYASAGVDAAMFWSGLGGVVLAVIGVEAFNEYFDARMGTDRVFNPADLPPISDAVFWCGVLAFAGALAVGIYISLRIGWPILAFALLGGLAGIFYEAPPIRWSYRGLGELVIGLAYGPWMVLGSLYLNTRALAWEAFAASLVPGLSIMSLAVVNAIPDYHQDLLVGKRNLVVRVGRAKAVVLYLALAGAALAVVAAGILTRIFPVDCGVALLALLPLVASGRRARSTFTTPRRFLPAVRYLVAYYTLATGLFAAGIVLHAWRTAS
jgi:1,4-dihydroxy-2-naphthoate octaprenyltransferase